MPTWGQLLAQIAQAGVVDLDKLRREALAGLYAVTGRPTVVYATRWLQGGGTPQTLSVGVQDVHALMEVLHGLSGPSIDLMIHSSGGSPMAAEAMINYIRTRFTDVRVIVPLGAMSAATMLACGANRILMGKHSYLGPVDPQLVLDTPLGNRAVPAQAIKDQFDLAQQASGTTGFTPWIPMLGQYGPDLLVTCENVLSLSRQLVERWLAAWMFHGDPEGPAKATSVANYLNNHSGHKVHGRFLPRDELRSVGLIIDDLEDSQELQDAVLTVFHAFQHTFGFTGVAKIVENHKGAAYILGGNVVIQKPAQPAPQAQPSPAPTPANEA